MKKFLTCAIAAGAVLIATSSAFAAFTVKVGTTQPKFGVKGACERAGTITFTFPSNSILKTGDTYSMTLQDGPVFCKTIDYVIGSSANGVALIGGTTQYEGVVFGPTTGQTGIVDKASGDPGVNSAVIWAPTALADGDLMPVKSTTANTLPATLVGTNNAVRDAANVPTNSPMYFHVYAKSGSTTATVKVLSLNAGDYISVGNQPADTLEIRLFNGKRYTDDIDPATPLDPTTATTVPEVTDAILLPTTITGIATPVYGIAVTDEEPTEKNTICVNVPTTFVPSCVEFRYDSSDIVGNTPCDFSNDFSIMCFESNQYTLIPCKGFIGEIPLQVTSQEHQASCIFDYETPGDSGYCALPTYLGNRIIIKSNKVIFAPTNEKMLLSVESLTSGLYLSGIPTVGTFSTLDKGCARNPGVTYKEWTYDHGDIDASLLTTDATYFDITTPVETARGTSTTFGETPNSSCSIPVAQRVTKIVQVGSAFSVGSKAMTMLIDLKPMIFDNTEFTLDKVEAKVKVALFRKPCGTIWTDTVKLGTFTKACSEVGTSLSLFFPYFPAMGEAWWSGIVITNGSADAGDATLTLYDEAGNSASFKTGSIPAGGQKVILLDDTITLTPVKGTFDKTKKFSIKASCEFSNAAGLVVFGNGLDGQGVYKPYLGTDFSSKN